MASLRGVWAIALLAGLGMLLMVLSFAQWWAIGDFGLVYETVSAWELRGRFRLAVVLGCLAGWLPLALGRSGLAAGGGQVGPGRRLLVLTALLGATTGLLLAAWPAGLHRSPPPTAHTSSALANLARPDDLSVWIAHPWGRGLSIATMLAEVMVLLMLLTTGPHRQRELA